MRDCVCFLQRSTDIRGPSFVSDIVAPMEQGGLLLTQEWQFYAPWLALHHLDGYRPDLKIIDVNLVRRFWYLDYLEVHVPEYMDLLRTEVDTYKAQLYLFDHELQAHKQPAIACDHQLILTTMKVLF